jgi:type IV secretion system protein VirB1
MDLLSLAVLCGPLVHPQMTLQVIAVESQGQVYAIHDNTTGEHYTPKTLPDAVHLSRQLIDAGHRLDLGLMQINYEAWLRPVQFPLERALDPCTNITLGTTILSADYIQALTRSTAPGDALARALSLYNSGSESHSLSYARKVLGEAELGESASSSQRAARMARSAQRARLAPVTFSGSR